MLDSFFSWLTFIVNTPLFYLIVLFLVLGYIYVATQWQVRLMQWTSHHGRQGNRFTHVRMAKQHSEAVACDHCGSLIDHIAVRHTEDGDRLILCHSCSKAYGKAQRALYH